MKSTLIALSVPCWLFAGSAFADSLTLANNGGSTAKAISKVFDSSFTEKTGDKVVHDDANDTELPKIRAQIETGNRLWDLATTVSVREATMCSEGIIEQIDWSKYLNAEDFRGVGGFAKCGAPYSVSPAIVAYDEQKFPDGTGPKSLADFWDVQKFPGKRGMSYANSQETIELSLLADGVKPEDLSKVLRSPEGVDRAFAKLGKLLPYIRWWNSGSESVQLLMSGETVMTTSYPGRIYGANDANNRKLKIAWEAGFVATPMYLVIPAGTPKKDEAIKYIVNALAPEHQVAFSGLTGFPPSNAKAYAALPEGSRLDEPKKYASRGFTQVGSDYLTWYTDNADTLHQRFVKFVGSTK